MIDIINTIKQLLIDNGTENVYSAFDKIPLELKEKFFTVIGMKKFEYSKPVYSKFIIYMPFMAEAEIDILAPLNSSFDEICDYYETNIKNNIQKIVGLNVHISDISVKQDKNIGRLVLKIILSIDGLKKINREQEES